MEGVTAGEVVMDFHENGSNSNVIFKKSKKGDETKQNMNEDDVDVEGNDDEEESTHAKDTKSTPSNTQKIWQHTKTIDLKSDLYKDRWTKIDGKAAICNNCRKISRGCSNSRKCSSNASLGSLICF